MQQPDVKPDAGQNDDRASHEIDEQASWFLAGVLRRLPALTGSVTRL